MTQMEILVEMLTKYHERVYANQVQVFMDSHKNYLQNRHRFGIDMPPVISLGNVKKNLHLILRVMYAKKGNGQIVVQLNMIISILDSIYH